jgi:ABC-2 type transport system permease protein
MNLAPKWLGWISDVNPVRYSVDVIRAWFRMDFTSATSLRGLIVTLVFAAITFGWAMRTYAKMER